MEDRLVDSGGVNIIVPYDQELFDLVLRQAHRDGLSPALMAKARPITVNSFDYKSVRDWCEPLPLRGRKGPRIPENCNWFALGGMACYDKNTGLNFSNAYFQGIID